MEDGALKRRCDGAREAELIFGARPEDLEIEPPGNTAPGIEATVTFVEPIGPRTIVHLAAGERRLKIAKGKMYGIELGARVKAMLPPGKCHLFDAETGVALGLA